MKILSLLSYVSRISLFKTIRFNVHYFGLKNGLKLPVLVSKNYILHTLKGSVHIESPSFHQITLGFGGVGIFDQKYDRGIWQNSGDVYFNGCASFGHGSKISNGGTLVIGNNFLNTAKSEIVCQDKVTFGDNVLISWDCLIMDTDFHSILNNSEKTLNLNKEINVGNHVWIGCRSLILKGVSIPDDCIIAANSTITKSFSDSNLLIGGVNNILKTGVSWNGTFPSQK